MPPESVLMSSDAGPDEDPGRDPTEARTATGRRARQEEPPPLEFSDGEDE